jgi:hypothetical protein
MKICRKKLDVVKSGKNTGSFSLIPTSFSPFYLLFTDVTSRHESAIFDRISVFF